MRIARVVPNSGDFGTQPTSPKPLFTGTHNRLVTGGGAGRCLWDLAVAPGRVMTGQR